MPWKLVKGWSCRRKRLLIQRSRDDGTHLSSQGRICRPFHTAARQRTRHAAYRAQPYRLYRLPNLQHRDAMRWYIGCLIGCRNKGYWQSGVAWLCKHLCSAAHRANITHYKTVGH